jgi:preprotein translocase subunit SecG
MSGVLISLFTLILILVSVFLILIILMQKASSSGGMGAAMGGGMAESTFGTDTVNVLTKGTIYATIAFFIICLGLYLGYMASIDNMGNTGATLPHLQGENTNENSASALDSQDALIDIESIDTPAVLEASDFSDAPQNQHPDKRDPSEGANP